MSGRNEICQVIYNCKTSVNDLTNAISFPVLLGATAAFQKAAYCKACGEPGVQYAVGGCHGLFGSLKITRQSTL